MEPLCVRNSAQENADFGEESILTHLPYQTVAENREFEQAMTYWSTTNMQTTNFLDLKCGERLSTW